MTAQDIHDALTLLPVDLITAADRVRTRQLPKVIHWQRWVSLAAVLVLVLSTSLVFARDLMPGMGSNKKDNAVAEAPAAAAPMAPAPMEQEVAAEEAAPEAPASDVPASGSVTGSENGMQEDLYVNHSHRFAEDAETDKSTDAYCGNTTVVIDVAGEQFTVSGTDAVTVTDILVHLDYDPVHVCRCMTDITVDTETLTDIRINLGEAFARCEKGQAALTEEQVGILREIIDCLQ